MVEKQFNKGEVIFRQGAFEASLYKILSGKVGIFSDYGEPDEHMLTELSEGEYFGELGVLEYYVRSATAVALEEGTKVLEIAEEDLKVYLEKNPEVSLGLMKQMGNRLRDITKDYNDVIALLNESKEKEDESLRERIRKHAAYFKALHKKDAPKDEISAESLRTRDEGFGKNVDTYISGTIICKEGETGDCMYEVRGGSVGIYSGYNTPEQEKLTVVGASEFFGEMGMLDNAPRSATAVVLEDKTEVERIYLDDLEELAEKNPNKTYLILMHLSSRIRSMSKEYLKACEELYKDVMP